ncbi:MAG: pentapeptide repeat-containing protein [Sphingobacteriales bacterium]|nr:MAG: pentapeptide repeat-containing protein [Sphingobacteriales bacterium]
MDDVFVQDKEFSKIDLRQEPLLPGEYEHCEFVGCNFSGVNLAKVSFDKCIFQNCDLSMINVAQTAFREVVFKDSKMLGIRFDALTAFAVSFSFDNCILTHSSFYQTKIKGTRFNNTILQAVDFTECDLTSAVFHNCDLKDANFDRTILDKADLTSAQNYSIDPERNKIKKAKFSLPGVLGLLHKYDIKIES